MNSPSASSLGAWDPSEEDYSNHTFLSASNLTADSSSAQIAERRALRLKALELGWNKDRARQVADFSKITSPQQPDTVELQQGDKLYAFASYNENGIASKSEDSPFWLTKEQFDEIKKSLHFLMVKWMDQK
jgi:hypothetical protein